MNKLYFRLALVPSYYWFIFYLFIIVAFTIFYFMMSNQFYHSTLKHDPKVVALEHEAEKLVERGMQLALVERKSAKTERPNYTNENLGLDAHGNKWNLSPYYATTYVTDEDDVSFEIYLVVDKEIDNVLEHQARSVKIVLRYAEGSNFSTNMPRLDLGLGALVHFHVVDDSSLRRYGYNVEDILRFVDRRADHPSESPLTQVSIPLDPKRAFIFADLENARAGLVQYELSSLIRSFYLSAATITTLGYGDVVPITSLGRIAIAFESIMGIVTIGLFLNSLARESAHNDA